MVSKVLNICTFLSLFTDVFAEDECGWKVSFVGFPNEFRYYSTCNGNKEISATMTSITEYTMIGIG